MTMPPEYESLNELVRLSGSIVLKPFDIDVANAKLLMIYFMFQKQYEHARSILVLAKARQDYDALLIARAALEAYALLKWASQNFDERARAWLGFGVVEEHRYQLMLDRLKKPMDVKIQRAVDSSLDTYSKGLIEQEYLDRIEGRSKKKQVPKDKYAKDWVPFQEMRDLFVAAGLEKEHHYYERASKWMHSTPRAVAGMIEGPQSPKERITGYSEELELALILSANAFLHSLQELVDHFESELPLNFAETVRRIRTTPDEIDN